MKVFSAIVMGIFLLSVQPTTSEAPDEYRSLHMVVSGSGGSLA